MFFYQYLCTNDQPFLQIVINACDYVHTEGSNKDIPKVKLKTINHDRMLFTDFSVNFEPISLNFFQGHFLFKSSISNLVKLFLLFQNLDNLPCDKILELV